MITSQSIQRLALSAALLVLPLIIYCSEISGSPQTADGPADKVETVTSAASSAADSISIKDEAQDRRVLADVDGRRRSGS